MPTQLKPRQARRRSNSRKLVIAVLLLSLAFIIVSISAFVFWKQAQSAKIVVDTSTTDSDKALLDEIRELIDLPTDETPTIGTVNDPEVLRDQPFFKNGKKGDRLIIYSKAGKAILYDPIAHKIIEVAPLSLGTEPKL